MPQHDRRSMTGDLDDVVGRVGMRLREVRRDNLVDPIAGFRLDQLSEVRASSLKLLPAAKAQEPGGDSLRLGSRDTHHANASTTRWSRNSDDRVIQLHAAIVKPRVRIPVLSAIIGVFHSG
jgi:hypothetical protein